MNIVAADAWKPRGTGLRGVAAVWLCLCLAACDRSEQTSDAPKPASAPLGDAVLLGSVAAPPYEYRLVLPNACPDTCQTLVQLITQGRVVDTFALPYDAYGREYYPRVETSETDWRWGADRGLRSWSTGGENSDVSSVARVVQLTPGMSALLVSQRAGWEHVNRAHVLIAPREGKLFSLWSTQEYGDSAGIFTEVAPEGRPGLVSFKVEYGAYVEGQPADTLSVSHVVWNPATQKMEEHALPQPGFPLYLLSVGSYASIAAARAAENRCWDFGRLSVLDAQRYASLVPGVAFNGWVFARKEEAEAALQEIVECAPGLAVAVQEYRAADDVPTR